MESSGRAPRLDGEDRDEMADATPQPDDLRELLGCLQGNVDLVHRGESVSAPSVLPTNR
jgi:hypothetical protein